MNNKYSNIDDLFRDKFKDFELYPPDHIWENIKQQIEVPGSGRPGKTISNGGILGITIILVLTGIFTLYFLQNKADNEFERQTNKLNTSSDTFNKSTPRSATIPSDQANDPVDLRDDAEPVTEKTKGKEKQTTRFDLSSNGTIEFGKSNLNATISNPSVSNNQNTKESDIISDPIKSAEPFSSEQFNIIPGNDSELLALNPEEPAAKEPNESSDESVKFADDEIRIKEPGSAPEPMPDIQSDYGKKGNWLFGLYFTPEIVFHPSASEFNSRNYSLEVNAIYQFSGYSIQSGVGIGWASDNGNYKIDYNQYLGSYDDVYDITFDTINGQLIPFYHTENVSVYDTIDHVSITPTKRHFTYLNIPVLFGYGSEGKRWGWFVKAGPSISILFHENVPDINLSDSQNKIVNVENEIPGRLKTNWQFVISAGASFKLNNCLSLTIEPLFKYYVNSIHEQNNISTKNPYSFGLRSGVILGF